jgi:hypothetical protein
MVRFKNLNYTDFLREAKDKRIICYGAGGTLRDFLRLNRAKVVLMESIDFVLDSDFSKSGQTVNTGAKEIPIAHPAAPDIANLDRKRYVMILCVADNHTEDALRTLDRIPAFDNMSVIYGMTAIAFGRELYYRPKSGEIPPHYGFEYRIPKIIHYCWFGGKPLGRAERECIDSWKEHCPDYEIRLWDESNYPIKDKPLYVRQAYASGKYAFVSDYARLDVVNRHGGVYFDVDVLLLRNIDVFLRYKAFFAYLPYNEISTGLGFGSVAGNSDLRAQMKIYERTRFIIDGETNLSPCPEYSTDFFLRKGVAIDNKLRLVDGTLFLPSDYLCSLMPVLCENGMYHLPLYALTENSYAVHKCASTWMENDMNMVFRKAKKHYGRINARLLSDWKREYAGR